MTHGVVNLKENIKTNYNWLHWLRKILGGGGGGEEFWNEWETSVPNPQKKLHEFLMNGWLETCPVAK